METAVANLVREGTRVARRRHRLLRRSPRADVRALRRDGDARSNVEWGRACDPDALRAVAGGDAGATSSAMVHAETSTGVLNPVERAGGRSRASTARSTIVDAVTSFGGHPLDVGAWGIDACYSCTQKCLGAPSGLAPVVFGPRALERARASAAASTSISQLLEDYWLRRKYHHTMSSTLVYALDEALAIVEEEGLEARWARHERNHRAFVDGLQAHRPVAAAAGRRAAVDAERRPRARRRRRGGRAEAAARGVQHRDRRRPRPAGRARSGASA